MVVFVVEVQPGPKLVGIMMSSATMSFCDIKPLFGRTMSL
jgi:hypothetical protein